MENGYRTLSKRQKAAIEVAVWALALAGLLAMGISYAYLPDKIAYFWTLTGEVSRMQAKDFTLFVIPAMGLVIALLLALAPKFDPNRHNYVKFERSYAALRVFVNVLVTGITALYILRLFLPESKVIFSLTKAIVAVFIILVGNMLPKIKRNYFIGLTTPWSVASSEVWFKTQRFGAKLFAVIGIALFVLSFFNALAVNIVYWCLIVCLVVAPIIYSANKFYQRNVGGKKK